MRCISCGGRRVWRWILQPSRPALLAPARAYSGDDGVHLRVSEQAARGLRERWHRGACHAVGSHFANYGVVRGGKISGVGETVRDAALAADAVASRAILRVERIEIDDVFRLHRN